MGFDHRNADSSAQLPAKSRYTQEYFSYIECFQPYEKLMVVRVDNADNETESTPRGRLQLVFSEEENPRLLQSNDSDTGKEPLLSTGSDTARQRSGTSGVTSRRQGK